MGVSLHHTHFTHPYLQSIQPCAILMQYRIPWGSNPSGLIGSLGGSVNTFLELLKAKIVEAEARFIKAGEALKEGTPEYQTATQKFQRLQGEHQAASQEFNSLKILIDSETRKEAALQSPLTAGVIKPPPTPVPEPIEPDLNKTAIIRDVLRQHPTGMTPGEVWRIVKNQIPRRNYVYAVLGRLKDREQVTVRRGKYYFRIPSKAEESKGETLSVQ
jgi:hypothetical protein